MEGQTQVERQTNPRIIPFLVKRDLEKETYIMKLQPILYRSSTEQYEALKRIKSLTRRSINSMLIDATED